MYRSTHLYTAWKYVYARARARKKKTDSPGFCGGTKGCEIMQDARAGRRQDRKYGYRFSEKNGEKTLEKKILKKQFAERIRNYRTTTAVLL